MFLRVLAGLMTLLFLFSVAVQYNDPDWYVWMAIYAAAAILSALAALRPGKPDARAAALVALIAAVWALTIVPRVWGRVTWAEIAGNYVMKTPVIEEARECIGLTIVAVWSAVLAIARWPRRRA